MFKAIEAIVLTLGRITIPCIVGMTALICTAHSSTAHALQDIAPYLPNRVVIKFPFDIYTDTPRVAIDNQNRIIVAASIFSNNYYDAVLFRFLPDGSRDLQFSPDGMIRIKATGLVGSITKYTVHTLAISNEGKIVLAGSGAGDGNNGDFLLMRYQENGQPDLSLNKVGWASTSLGGWLDFGWGIDEARAVLIQQDGAIVLAGGASQSYAFISGRYDFGVVRFQPDGTLDRTFANNGKGVFRLGTVSEDYAYAAAQDHKQRLIIAGKLHTRFLGDMAMIRLDSYGKLDSTFGAGGKVTTQFGEAGSDARSIAIDNNHRIVVSGRLYKGDTGGYIQRYTDSGMLDRSFGTDGTVRIHSLHELAMLKLQRDNKIIIVGTRYATQHSSPAIVTIRLNPDGTRDKAYGSAGESVVEFDTPVTATSIALSGDNDIYVCGSASRRYDNQRNNNGLLLFKLDPYGTLNPFFGQ